MRRDELIDREAARRRARRMAANLMRERLQPFTDEEWEAVELEQEGRLHRIEDYREGRHGDR